MATLATSPSTEMQERRFFLFMAVAFAATVVGAFGFWNFIGRSTFRSPWFTHVHAISFMGWIAIYLAQNILVFRNDMALHRRLGKLGAAWAIWIILIGLILTPYSLSLGRKPPFFTPPFFLALDWGSIVLFAALIFAAVRNVSQTDWHRRLMLCATASVIAPAWGRLLAYFDVMGAWTNAFALLAYVGIAMIADLLIRKSIHRAYYWGCAGLLLWPISIELLTRFPPFVALAQRIAG